ncbi:MAG: sugar ABC transporter permease [Bacteroidetes bacterium]|nr:sugar ABC transporter permease [Bacteroidota bacterium]
MGKLTTDKKFVYAVTLPVAIILLLIGFVPMIFSFIISLTNYSLIQKVNSFIGFTNYIRLLTDQRFLHSITFTILFGLVAVGIELVIGFIVAYVLADKDVSSRYSSVMRTLVMIPFIVAPIAIAFIYKSLIYHYYSGYLNYFLGLLHLPKFIVFHGRVNGIIAVLVMEVIARTPFMVLVLFAGITSVPHSILEAAQIDGANEMQRIFRVIIPFIRPVLVVACIFRYMGVMKIFDEIYVLTQGGPGYTTENVSLYATAQSYEFFHTGYSSTCAFIFFMIVMVLISFFLKVGKFGVK